VVAAVAVKGWGAVLVGGVGMGLLALFPAFDAVLWRATVWALPWFAAAAALVVVALVARGLRGKGQGR
jgi:uncharacterized membrane protein